ncbi:hypothetical protein GGTG_02616 [Gaeumannomyces tritici R3-111a-1]|uniref:Uncharacterized protein n=1 Tax=Gaeumannomyces tritici (strain R3-111a-1) TaxID=644352 RepID=J3NMV8_GAET3|nr:hypothetical protein GGTG_02616 [Gaeumannomyces tritici R3-111a-1]EJT77509.1 hypothetical protein GGTG_02616 [Gaeumannomyces tritici R3-111a-1]
MSVYDATPASANPNPDFSDRAHQVPPIGSGLTFASKRVSAPAGQPLYPSRRTAMARAVGPECGCKNLSVEGRPKLQAAGCEAVSGVGTVQAPSHFFFWTSIAHPKVVRGPAWYN